MSKLTDLNPSVYERTGVTSVMLVATDGALIQYIYMDQGGQIFMEHLNLQMEKNMLDQIDPAQHEWAVNALKYGGRGYVTVELGEVKFVTHITCKPVGADQTVIWGRRIAVFHKKSGQILAMAPNSAQKAVGLTDPEGKVIDLKFGDNYDPMASIKSNIGLRPKDVADKYGASYLEFMHQMVHAEKGIKDLSTITYKLGMQKRERNVFILFLNKDTNVFINERLTRHAHSQ